jgi:hypothetical protein
LQLRTWVLSRILFIVVAIAVVVLLSSVNPRPTKSDQVSLNYDPRTELATTGIVEDVQVFQYPLSAGLGTHLVLRTESGTVIVHVAPARLSRTYELTVASADHVKIVGAKVRYAGADALIGREITSRNRTFIFRRPNGKPLWEE